MKLNYIFDVDGTLTPSRSKMNVDFHLWFSDFCDKHNVYLVTGSDRKRTEEQVTPYIYNKCKAVYQCSGNEKWVGDELVRSSTIDISDTMGKMLLTLLDVSQFKNRTGNHLDVRSGQANFSVVGRGTTSEQRESYIEWDKKHNERSRFAEILNIAFGEEYDFSVAGETGIDITYKNSGKEQILLDFDGVDVVFFGDMIVPNGNDYSIAKAIEHHTNISKAIKVKDWRDTWQLLAKIP